MERNNFSTQQHNCITTRHPRLLSRQFQVAGSVTELWAESFLKAGLGTTLVARLSGKAGGGEANADQDVAKRACMLFLISCCGKNLRVYLDAMGIW